MRFLLLLLVVVGAGYWYFERGNDTAPVAEYQDVIEKAEKVVAESQNAGTPPAASKPTANQNTSSGSTSQKGTQPAAPPPPPTPPPPTQTEEETVPEKVIQLPAPVVTLQASDLIIESGDKLTLTWSVENADSCQSSGFLTYGDMSGKIEFEPTGNITFELNCSGKGGQASKSLKVYVVPLNFTGATLQVSDDDITSEESVLLMWDAINVSSCKGTGFNASGLEGKVIVSPDKTTNYSITCTNNSNGASASESVLVKVTFIPPEESGPPDTEPPVISEGEPIGMLTATTTKVTLRVQTDEKASCRYTLFSGTQFQGMSSFNSTNSTKHSTNISSLLPHEQYRYYVRCEDEAGNRNEVDYLIQFTTGEVL